MRSLISQLKIPGQPSRLTRMMVVGCEGNVLADWTWTLGHGASAGWRGPALERSFTWTGGASLPAIIPPTPRGLSLPGEPRAKGIPSPNMLVRGAK